MPVPISIVFVVFVLLFIFGIFNICSEKPTKAAFLAVIGTAWFMSSGVCISLFYILSQKFPEVGNLSPALVIFSCFFSFVFLVYSFQKEGKTKEERERHLPSVAIFGASASLQFFWLALFFAHLFSR